MIKTTLGRALAASIALASMWMAWTFFQETPSNFKNSSEGEWALSSDYDTKSEELSKTEPPDPAWAQNFELTKNPDLGYPTPEKLIEARNRIEASHRLIHQKNAGILDTNLPTLVWEERGPYNVGGRTRTLMYDPNDPTSKKVWAGAVGGGLWYNTDIGNTANPWVPVNDFWQTLSVNCMAYDPTNTQVFYVGTGEHYGQGYSGSRGQGIFKTTDGGNTWTQLSSSLSFDHIRDIVVRDENGLGVVYVGVREQNYEGFSADDEGLFRSTDGGQSFVQVMDTIPGTSTRWAVSDLEIGADNRLWVGTAIEIDGSRTNNDGGGDILYSDDGLNFTVSRNTNGGRVEVACAPSDPAVLYALIERNGGVDKILRSLDTGATWQSMPEPADDDPGIPNGDFSRGQAWYDLIAQVDPNDPYTLVVGGIDLFRSTDSANTWTQLSHWYGGFGHPYVHADQHQLIYKPGSSTEILSGSDGGVSISTNFTAANPSWIEHNDAYTTTQFYAGAINPNAGSDIMFAGAQDNGTQRVNGPGNSAAIRVTGGDGAFCFVDEVNPNIVITSFQLGRYNISFDGGNNFSFLTDLAGPFIAPADYDSDLGILYSSKGFNEVHRAKNLTSSTVTREVISLRGISARFNSTPTHLRVSPYSDTASTLWVGGGNARLVRVDSADSQGNEIITNISGTNFPAAAAVSCVEVGRNEDELAVTFSNYGVNSVYYTNDGGQTWENKEGDLPDMPVRWALFNPRDYNNVLLATELGVWETRNFMDSIPNWVPSNNGMPNVRVDMLQLRQSDYTIMASTHGRGMFTAQFKGGIGLEENQIVSNARDFRIFPNPIKNQFQIDFEEEGIWELNLYDLSGKLRFQDRWNAKDPDKIFRPLSLEPGTYIAHLRKGSNYRRVKIQVR